jgi:hypothetical protein
MKKDNARQKDEPLELVWTCGPTEAEMISEMLDNNGIECTLQGEGTAITLPATGDLDEVRIWVKRDDATKAREIVDAFFDEDAVDEEPEET